MGRGGEQRALRPAAAATETLIPPVPSDDDTSTDPDVRALAGESN